MASSAFFSCQIPTTAFAMRMRRMTKGSTKAVMPSSSLSSKRAKTNEIQAARSKIRTSKSILVIF